MPLYIISEGHMILGCSNLTGRFWIGSLWYYRDPCEAPSVEKALTGVDFDNGLVDGFFLDEKNVSQQSFSYRYFVCKTINVMTGFHIFHIFVFKRSTR